MKRCTQLAEAIVSGEPLSDDDRAHLTTCADCTRLAAMPRLVAATATAPEPGPGFSSRIVVGARERVAGRRRQRVIGFGLATAVAAGAAVMIVRHDDGGGRARAVATSERPAGGDTTGPLPDPPPGDGITDDELRELVSGDSLSQAMTPSADWADIETPLTSYRAVLRLGGQP